MECTRCGGFGYFPQFSHVENGVCFRCYGSGVEPTETERPEPTRPAPARLTSAALHPVDRPRVPNGQFTHHDDSCSVTAVVLGNGRVGYRVGTSGPIYDDRETANRNAARLLTRYATM